MNLSNIFELAISLGLEIWLLGLLLHRKVHGHFPVFFFYILICLPITIARLLTSSHYRVYFFVYWWSNVALLLLGLAALHEVFYWVYKGFYRLIWFRFLYYGAIALVLLVTIRNSIANPPVQAHPVIGLILDVGIAINFIQIAIVGVFTALIKPLNIGYRRYPFGIAAGFGASAMGPLIGYFSRSIFGTRLDIFAQNASAIAYIFALVIWIMAFFRQEPEELAWTPPMSPEEMLRMVRGYLKVLRPGRKEHVR
jgi:hypothetical protein